MQPLRLTLIGFKGIRAGLGRDTLTLDLERLGDGAALIAITGSNGRGKSTVMDNLHPYNTLPSRAAAAGPGGFSYYDHVALSENEKDLTWAHEGCCYRSRVLIRLGARRRTEAYLYVLNEAGQWQPARMQDGTVSDGRIESYSRCVESICGSDTMFFTSMFSAQGKRQLSAYRHAEIKSLLADLLGQDEIQSLGRKAQDTTRFLKSALTATRQEEARWQEEATRLGSDRPALHASAQEIDSCATLRSAAQAQLQELKALQVRLTAGYEQIKEVESRRQELRSQQKELDRSHEKALQVLNEQDRGEEQRWSRLQQRINERLLNERQQCQALQARKIQCRELLHLEPQVQWARHRLPLAEHIAQARWDRVGTLQQQVAQLKMLESVRAQTEQRLASVEREAGQAVLRAEDLTRRFGLTDAVPCAGTSLQGQCQLLGDARQAQVLIPDAQSVLQRLAIEREAVRLKMRELNVQLLALQHTPGEMVLIETLQIRSAERVARLVVLAAKASEMHQAQAALAEIELGLGALARADGQHKDEEAERTQIEQARKVIQSQRELQVHTYGKARRQIQQTLESLPPGFDVERLAQVGRDVVQAEQACGVAEEAHLDALRDADRLATLQTQLQALAGRQLECQRKAQRIEGALSAWALFAKCMSADGLIALAIDDAGPTLSALANDLLRACYGERFSVSIQTLMETSKREQKEGFDIVVHDAESGESQSVTLMSGGERLWINEALVRAVALYLVQHAGRRYTTLLSDEADGPLDIDRKRMFMAMKREVLRLGGYEREFYISQTPELTAMADAVIDLDALRDEPEGVREPLAGFNANAESLASGS